MKSKEYKTLSGLMDLFIQKLIAMDRAEKVCYGVTLSQAYIIQTIYRNNMLSMNELSQEMGLAISTLTRIIDVLVRDEIVCRHACQEDRRKVRICLTDKGKELAQKLQNCSVEFWGKVIDNIPEKEHETIIKHLQMLLNALEGIQHSCCQGN